MKIDHSKCGRKKAELRSWKNVHMDVYTFCPNINHMMICTLIFFLHTKINDKNLRRKKKHFARRFSGSKWILVNRTFVFDLNVVLLRNNKRINASTMLYSALQCNAKNAWMEYMNEWERMNEISCTIMLLTQFPLADKNWFVCWLNVNLWWTVLYLGVHCGYCEVPPMANLIIFFLFHFSVFFLFPFD